MQGDFRDMKTVGENLKFIKENPVKITIESRHLPGGSDHNLVCWVCGKQSAIYSMYPDWCFLPCWECQEHIDSPVWRKKKWWEFWK